MAKHRTRVGLHARNDVRFTEHDYVLIRQARIETLKTMSHTDVSVYQRLRSENPNLEFIVRLYDPDLRANQRPGPAQFVAKMSPIINRLKPYAVKFEIHNEPNHQEGIEGWGSSDDNARSFREWYRQVLALLRQAHPWAKFGFPGLAPHHRDLPWLDICQDVIRESDWLGCHPYWQYNNMMKDAWGLRFKLYHERFPDKRIEITEFGNSTDPNQMPREEIARQYVRYYQELNKYPYLGSASAFIASSPDPTWIRFVWMKEGGEMLPVVHAIANMERKPATVVVPPKPKPKPKPSKPKERFFPETKKTVRGKFLEFFETYGLDLCGYPITEQFQEYGLPSQYFQRLALEETQKGKIRLKLVGSEVWQARKKIAELEAQVQLLSQKPPASGAARPPIQDITDDLPKHPNPNKRYATRALTDISRIIIHHTATAPSITPQRLAQYQVNKLDKPGIVYHFVVAADGTIYQTNRLETVAEHAYRYSPESIGIVFPGNFTNAIPTAAQLEAGGQLCAWLLTSLRLSTDQIVGLSELIKTQSPGRQWLRGKKWKDKLLEQVNAALENVTEDQTALIASLRAQIAALQEEIERLKEAAPPPGALPAPGPTPAPGPARVPKPAIQDVVDKLPKHPHKRYPKRALDRIQTLVVHHSAVPPSVGLKRIARYHIDKHGWAGIGYHFVIAEDGVIYQTNRLETLSNQVYKHNTTSIGVCLLGSFMGKIPPPSQLQATARLVAWLLQELDLDLDDVKGHQEMPNNKTACPGNEWRKGRKWKKLLRQEVTRIQEEAQKPEATQPAGDKALYHYMLFWKRNGDWAKQDWLNAQDYIGRFAPAVGFRPDEAVQAEYVTIVGGPLGVSQEVEDWLKANGCKVDRLAGRNEADTKRMLDELAAQGRRFRSFNE